MVLLKVLTSLLAVAGIVVGVLMFHYDGPAVSTEALLGRATMKALVFEAISQNIGDVVRIRDMPVPTLRDHDVLIEVEAAGLNPVDYKIVTGHLVALEGLLIDPPPRIIGYDVAGVVKALGPKVRGFQVGERVFAMQTSLRAATVAEFVAVPSWVLAKMPDNLSWVEAAATPLAAMTSLQGLRTAGVGKGSRVLITGGSGGTGTFGVMMAKAMGANVTATCSARNAALVVSLGADQIIDYQADNFESRLGKEQFDAVYDTVGGIQHWRLGSRALVQGGKFVTIAGDQHENMTVTAMLEKGGSILNRNFLTGKGLSYRHILAIPTSQDMEEIASMLRSGAIRVIVDSVFEFERGLAALQRVESGRSVGKVVIAVKPQPGVVQPAAPTVAVVPAVVEPVVPAVVEPVVPAVVEPAVPAVVELVIPAVLEPVPAVVELVIPAVLEPVAPAVVQPAVVEPTVVEPAVAEPVVAEPITTVPAVPILANVDAPPTPVATATDATAPVLVHAETALNADGTPAPTPTPVPTPTPTPTPVPTPRKQSKSSGKSSKSKTATE